MSDKQYLDYARQYENHRKLNPNVTTFFHRDFNEYLSCIRSMIVNCSDEKGKVTKFAIPVDDKQIDYVTDGKGFQTKKVGNFSSGDLERNRTKYSVHIEDSDNTKFCNQIIYKKIIRQKEMQSCIQENPDFLRGQELLKEDTFPEPGRSWFREFLDNSFKNAEIARKSQVKMEKQGYISLITQKGKTAGIEEKKIYKLGYPPFFRVETIKNGIKKLK